MRMHRQFVILFVVALIISVATFTGELILLFNGKGTEMLPLTLSCLILFPLAMMGVTYSINALLELNRSKNALIAENLYNLGVKSTFYDMNAFQIRLLALSRIRSLKKKKQFIIAFTASNLSVMQNTNRDEDIAAFNAKIAAFLETQYKVQKAKNKRRASFCFNLGMFYLYFYSDDEHYVKEVVNNISAELFRLAEEKVTSIWVQPFFGVAEIATDAPLIESIENAQIARAVSERNFESLTYYHESFRGRSSKEDIDEITKALEEEEFVVYYQPKFSLGAKRFISSEALIRWNSKEHGLLSPAKFIPIVESAGLIHEVDTYVFRKVCEDLNEAKRKGRRIIPVSINFSIYEFYSPEFLNSIMSLLDQYQINSSYIEIEITEATSRANTFVSVSIIKKLRERGIRVLMDDFGVGFSNIGNLRKIPFDAVKIDKSFIDDIVTDPKSRAIVKFLIELCQANGMEVIAEGVDNKDQVAILKQYKCNTIQGFYYSQALPYREYEKFLLSNPFEKKEAKK
ncbi:MAG: EAL domain-containing protein [Bacilli bacterium]|nr:EAL domain-containing protein [Bacilli bacterium]